MFHEVRATSLLDRAYIRAIQLFHHNRDGYRNGCSITFAAVHQVRFQKYKFRHEKGHFEHIKNHLIRPRNDPSLG